jgi:hypothetical protein
LVALGAAPAVPLPVLPAVTASEPMTCANRLRCAPAAGVDASGQLLEVMFAEAAAICGEERVSTISFEHLQKIYAAVFGSG